MKQYKTIAGPIELKFKAGELKASEGEGYANAVKQYAAIIDAEAVGGWELHLIQQITVKKLVRHTVIIGAILGVVLGLVVGGMLSDRYDDFTAAGFFLGGMIGAGFGCLGIKYVAQYFNMLVFVKDK